MRARCALLLLLALAGCGSQEDFAQRYRAREEALQQSANRMEQEIAQQLSQGAEADKAMGVEPPPVAPPEQGASGEGTGPQGRDSIRGQGKP